MKSRHLVGPGVCCQARGIASELVPFRGPVDNEAPVDFIDKEARVLPLRGP